MGCGSSSSAADVGPSSSFDVKAVKRSQSNQAGAAARSHSNDPFQSEGQSTDAHGETYEETDGINTANGLHSHASTRSTPPRTGSSLANTLDAPAASIEAGSLSIDDLQRSAFRLQLSSEAYAALRKAMPSSPPASATALSAALRSLQQVYEDYHSFHVRRIQLLRFIPNSPPALSLIDWLSCCMLHCKNSIERTLLGSDVLSCSIRAYSPFLNSAAQLLQQFANFLREQFYPTLSTQGLHQQAIALFRAVQLQVYHKRHWMKYLLLPFHVLQLQAVEASHANSSKSAASASLKREWIQSMKPKVLALESQIESMNAQLISIGQWFPHLADVQNELISPIIKHVQRTIQSHGKFMQQSFSDLILGIEKWFEGLAPPVNVTLSPVKTVTSISGGANTTPINPLLIVQLPDLSFFTIITSHFAPRILAVHHIGLPSISLGESNSNWRGLHPLCLASFLRNMVLDIVCQLVQTLNIPSSASSRAGLTPNYPSIVFGLLDAIGYNRDTNPSAKSTFEQMNELELWHTLVVGPLQQIKPFIDSSSALRYAIAIAGIDEPSAFNSLAASILHPTSTLGLNTAQTSAISSSTGTSSAATRDASPARGAGYSSSLRADKDRYSRAQRDAQSNAPRNPFLLFLSKVLHTLPPWIGVILLSTSGSKVVAAPQYAQMSPTPPLQSLSPSPAIISPSGSIGSPNARPRSREVKESSEPPLSTALRRFQPQVLDFSSVFIFHETELFELVQSRLQYYVASQHVNVAVVETIVSHAKECREGWRYAELVCEFLGSELCLQTEQHARDQILSHDTVSAIPHQTINDLYGFILRSIYERLALLDQSMYPSTMEVLQLLKLATCALEPISIETISQVYNQHVSPAAGVGADPVQSLQIFEVVMRLTPLLAVQFPDSQSKPFPASSTFESIDLANTRVTVRNVSIQNWLLTLNQTPALSSNAGGAVVSPKPRRTKTQLGGKPKPTHHSEFSMPQVLTMDGSTFQLSDFACDATAVHTQWAKICFERLQTTRSDKKFAKQQSEDEFEELYAGRADAESDTTLLQVELLYENGPTRPAHIPKDQLLLYAIEFGPSHSVLALTSAVSTQPPSIQLSKGDGVHEENELSSLCALVESAASYLTNLQYLHMRFAIGIACEAESWKVHDRLKPISYPHQALQVEYAQVLAIASNLLKRAQPPTVPGPQVSPTSSNEDVAINEGSIELNAIDPHQQLFYYTHALEAMREFVANNSQSFACDPWLVYSYALSYPDAVQSTIASSPTLNDTSTAMNPAMSPTASSSSTASLSNNLPSALAHFVWNQVQSLARVGWLESYFWPLATRTGAGGALDHFRGAQLMRNARQVDSDASSDGLFGEGGCWNAWLRWRNKPSILPSLISSSALIPLLVNRSSAPRVNAVAISSSGNFAAFAGDSSRDGLTNIVLVNSQTNKPHNVLIGETGNTASAPQPASPTPMFGAKPTHRITSLCFTTDSRFLLSLHVSPEFTGVKMWEALGGKLVTSLTIPGRHSSTTASGSSLASKGRRGMERIEPVTSIPNPSVMVLAPDGNVLAISGLGCPLLLATLQPRQFLHGRSTSPAPNASNSTGGGLVAPVLRVQQSLQNFSKEVLSVAFSPSNYDLVANDGNEILRLWDTRNGKLMRSIVLQQGGVPAAESLVVDANLFSRDGMFIFVAIHSPNVTSPQSERSLRIYNYDSGLWVHSIQFPSIVASVMWSRQPKREAGQMVFSSSSNEYFLTLCSNAPHQTVQLWSFRSKPVFEILSLATVNVASTCVGQNARITCFDYCEERKRLMVGGEEGVVRVYHLDAAAYVASLPVVAPSQISSSAAPVVYTFAEGSNVAVAVPRKPYAAASRRQIAGSGAVVSNSNYNSNANHNFSSPPRQLTVSTGFGSPPQRKGGVASKYAAASSNVPSPKSPLSPADARVYIDATQSNANVPSQLAPTSPYSSLPTHRQTTLAFAPNSKQLLASSWDGCVRVYDIAAGSSSASSASASKSLHAETPELVLRVECSSGLYGAAWIAPSVQKPAAAVGTSSIGKGGNAANSQMQILSCSYNDEYVASVWNASDGALIRNIGLPRGETGQEGASDDLQMFTTMAVSPNSRWLVARKEPSHTTDDSSTAHSEEISVFELYSNRSSNFQGYRRKVLTSLGHTTAGGATIGDITSLTFSFDSNLVASCSTDGTLRVVELESGTSIRKFYASSSQSSHTSSGNPPHFICARFSPDNRCILAGVSTGSICMYSLESGQLLFELSEAHACEVVAVDFQRDGLYFLSAGARDGCVKLWRQGDQSLISILQLHHPQLDSGFGKASTASSTKCIVPTAPSGEIAAAVFSPDGNWIAVSGAQKFISLFSLQAGSVSLGSGHGSSNVGGSGGFLATQPRPPERLMLVQPTRMHQAAVVVTAMLAKGGGISSPKASPPQNKRGRLP